jgi:DNA-directed RNA polymerase specialized sigma24 family protein
MEVTETQSNITISEERLRWFTQLYEDAFPKVAKFVANRGGAFEDARDIFQDALVILYEKTVHEKLEITGPSEYYLVGIAKHLWIRKFNDDHKKVGLDAMESEIAIPGDYFDTSLNRLASLLELTGRKCMELLQAIYYDNRSLKEIKSVFGFSSVHSASVQKFKCIERMRNMVKAKSMGYEDFK